MRNLKKDTVIVDKIVSITCDVCGKTDESKEVEFIHIEHVGGYFSTIGDCVKVEVDICDSCFKSMFQKYWKKFDQNFAYLLE